MVEASVDRRRPESTCSLWCGGLTLGASEGAQSTLVLLVRTDSHSSIKLSTSRSSNQKLISATLGSQDHEAVPGPKISVVSFCPRGTPQIMTSVQSLPFLSSLISEFLREHRLHFPATKTNKSHMPQNNSLRSSHNIVGLSSDRVLRKLGEHSGKYCCIFLSLCCFSGRFVRLWRALRRGSQGSVVILKSSLRFAFTQILKFFCKQHFQWRAKTRI